MDKYYDLETTIKELKGKKHFITKIKMNESTLYKIPYKSVDDSCDREVGYTKTLPGIPVELDNNLEEGEIGVVYSFHREKLKMPNYIYKENKL